MATLTTLIDRLAAAVATSDPASRTPQGALWATPDLPSCNVPNESVPVSRAELDALATELGGKGADARTAILRGSRGHAERSKILEILRTAEVRS